MKKFVVVLISMIAVFCFSCKQEPCKVFSEPLWAPVSIIEIKSPVEYYFNKNGNELDVVLDIESGFSDDAYLLLDLKKKNDTKIEGFKDSLIMNGFFVRSYFLSDSYINGGIDTAIDYPVYIKKLVLDKGINKVSFTIIFPRNIDSFAEIAVNATILRNNYEIKSQFEEYEEYREYTMNSENRLRRKNYFEAFPDSSVVSYIFSNDYQKLYGLTLLSKGEGPFINSSSTCGKFQIRAYYNCSRISFFVKH